MRPIFILLIALPVGAQTICPPTPAWSPCEIRVSQAAASLRAEFRSPSHKTFLIQSFAEGKDQVFRIVPTEAGTWDFRIEGKDGTFTATASSAPGYIETANVHHFRYSASRMAHLWMGDIAPALTGEAFAQYLAARVSQGFTHIRIAPDERVLAIHRAGLTADLVVPPDADMGDIVARYGALNVTWQIFDGWEAIEHGREKAQRVAETIKAADQYRHLLSAGALSTSGPLIHDGWLRYLTFRSSDGDIAAIQHQVYPLPSVNNFGAGVTNTDEFRHALWRTTMDGTYPQAQASEAAAAQMRYWRDFFAGTRFWELQPFFDADGRRALALEGVEYIVYAETPGPVTVMVEKHNYDVAWFNPVSGERIPQKNLKIETFTGDPPDNSHDWVLHIEREGHKAGMLKSYKFESREVLQQEEEVNPARVPFEIALPAGESISLANPGNFAVKLTKDTKASRAMRYLWTGEVTADGESYRVLGTGAKGQLAIPSGLAARLPALLHLRVEGLNGVGKLYSLDRNYQLTP